MGRWLFFFIWALTCASGLENETAECSTYDVGPELVNVEIAMGNGGYPVGFGPMPAPSEIAKMNKFQQQGYFWRFTIMFLGLGLVTHILVKQMVDMCLGLVGCAIEYSAYWLLQLPGCCGLLNNLCGGER